MKTSNLKQFLSGLARVLLIASGLCILLGIINGILRNSWDVFSIGLMGLLLFVMIGTLYAIIELIVRRFTSQKTLDAILRTPDPNTIKMVADRISLEGVWRKVHSRKSIGEGQV